MMNKKIKYRMNKRELKRYYSSIIPTIREVARECGYAIAIHGSMTRDLDIMAMPWVEKAKAPETLATEIMKKLCGHSYMRTYWKEHKYGKPHGRLTYTIPVKQNAYIDLSVMPRSRD